MSRSGQAKNSQLTRKSKLLCKYYTKSYLVFGRCLLCMLRNGERYHQETELDSYTEEPRCSGGPHTPSNLHCREHTPGSDDYSYLGYSRVCLLLMHYLHNKMRLNINHTTPLDKTQLLYLFLVTSHCNFNP